MAVVHGGSGDQTSGALEETDPSIFALALKDWGRKGAQSHFSVRGGPCGKRVK
jgi:hypothetical protein